MVKREPGMDAPKMSEGERSEPERSGGASTPASAPAAADPEVSSKADTPEIQCRIQATHFAGSRQMWVREQLAALLRREGLYSSHLTTWRKQRESGEIAGLEPRKRGKKPVPRESADRGE